VSTIAFDGVSVAHDSQIGAGNRIDNAEWKKVRSVQGTEFWCAGGTGEADAVNAFIEWVEDGAGPDYPEICKERSEHCCFIAIDDEMLVHTFERRPVSTVVERPPFACGSGSDYALGAMYAGEPAEGAVHIARQLDPHTGGPVYWFKPPKALEAV